MCIIFPNFDLSVKNIVCTIQGLKSEYLALATKQISHPEPSLITSQAMFVNKLLKITLANTHS